MTISGLRVRITIQKNVTVIDRYGNHISEWQDYASCWAAPSAQSGEEVESAAHTVEGGKVEFTVRFSTLTAAVTAKQYRILFRDEVYNITHVDNMGYKRISRKFRCELTER